MLAVALVRRLLKLSLVNVYVAVLAGRQLDFVHSADPDRKVALCASDTRVLSFQRIFCRCVFLHSKG